MKFLNIPTLLFLALPAISSAGEVTVEPAPFEATVQLEGTLLPQNGQSLLIDTDRWTTLKILEVKEQGAAVKKGEPVVTLDLEGIDRKIADDKTAARLRALGLANAERELANLKVSTDWKLAVAKRQFERTKEDLAYFKEVGLPLSKEATARSVDRAKRSLENQEEELAQLLKMYEEDDLTEETEEIILKRQKNAVRDATYMLRRMEISAKQTLEVELPRQSTDLEQGFKDAELTWNSQKEILPRALEQKTLEVETMRLEDQRAKEAEAEVVADRKKMTPTAPIDGRIYHGEISDGKWVAANAAKFMKEGGLIPVKTIYATVIPNGGVMEVHAFADESQIGQIRAAKDGFLAPTAAPRSRVPLTVKSADAYPGVDGKYHVVLTPGEELKALNLVAGMKGQVTLVTTRKDKAIAVPKAALHEEGDGSFTVKIKLADGASEKRVVVPGAEAKGKVEILKGLEAGQVVLVEGEES
jgi:hypothetical protein